MNNIYENIDIMSKGLDVAWLRNDVISNNIANVNTPGYKASRVIFEDLLEETSQKQTINMKKTHPTHIGKLSQTDISSKNPKIIRDDSKSLRNDKNNVDIDKEMAELTKNNIRFNYISEQISRDFNKIRNTINAGRR